MKFRISIPRQVPPGTVASLCALLTYVSPAVAAAGDSVTLVAPFITGSSVYSARELSDVFSSQIGTPVTAQSLGTLVTAIESRYRGDGFVAPVVTLDQNAEQSGTPRLYIHEAAVTQVKLQGDAGPNQEQLLEYIDELATLRPLRTEQTRQILAAIQRLPGIAVRASFEPCDARINEFRLVMQVGYKAASAEVSSSNRGSRASGRQLFAGRVTFNGLLGQQEFLTLDGAASTSFDQYHYAGLSVARAFSSTWLSLSASRSHARPWAASDLYDRNRYALQVLTPAWTSDASLANALVRLVVSDSKLANDDFGPLSREQLRKVEMGVSWTATRAPSRLSALLVQGVDALGAGARSYDDWQPMDPVFTKLIVSGGHALSVGSGLRLTGDFLGEYAVNETPSSEQFVFGGYRFGRGLEAADLVGRSGAAVSLGLEGASPWKSLWMHSATLYTGLDYGYAWTTNAGFRRDHAATTRAGIAFDWGKLSQSFELAYALHRPHYSETDTGVAAFFDLQWAL